MNELDKHPDRILVLEITATKESAIGRLIESHLQRGEEVPNLLFQCLSAIHEQGSHKTPSDQYALKYLRP